MQPRPVRRKPPPTIDAGLTVAIDTRYPAPDPTDPFAPLWVLRSRTSNSSLTNVGNLRAPATPLPVAFPVIHDTASENSTTTDTEHHAQKWQTHLLRRLFPPSSSASTSASFAHVDITDDVAPSPHSQWALPTPAQLARAAPLPIIASSGLRVPFASLFAVCPTIVIFIRHFWCPHCQDYVSSIAHTAPRPSEKHPFALAVISNGSPAFIPKYRALFALQFDIYTDPTLAVYTALGMGRSASLSCPPPVNGNYARHSTMGGIATVVYRALKAGLPVWERGGDIHQLGGEFVLGPGLTCAYAHRMQSPKDHAPIHAVLSAAGINIPPRPSSPAPPVPKLLAPLRIKPWAHQKRSSSTSVIPPTPPPPPTENRHKNTHAAPSPVDEFGVCRRAARASLDSSRALSEGAHQSSPRSQSLPYAWHRHCASSTATLPVCSFSADTGDGDGRGWMRARMASLEAKRERKRERRAGFVGYFVPIASPRAGRPVSVAGGCEPVREDDEETVLG